MADEVPASAPAPVAAPEATEAKTETTPEVSPKETKEVEKRKYKLKIDGNEEEWDEDKVLTAAQRSAAADKRFAEAAKSRKESERVQKILDSGDRKAIQKLFGDEKFHKMAVEYFNERLEDEELSPQDRKIRDLERKIQETESEKKKSQEERDAKEMEALQEHYSKQFDKEFSEALSSVNLPNHPSTVKRMAELMEQNLNMGLDLPAATIARMVEEEFAGSIKSLVSALDGDRLVSMFGDEVVGRIRQANLKKVGLTAPTGSKRTESASQESKPKSGKALDYDDWKEAMQRIKNGEE
jgi:hypothetical protein